MKGRLIYFQYLRLTWDFKDLHLPVISADEELADPGAFQVVKIERRDGGPRVGRRRRLHGPLNRWASPAAADEADQSGIRAKDEPFAAGAAVVAQEFQGRRDAVQRQSVSDGRISQRKDGPVLAGKDRREAGHLSILLSA